MADDITNIVLLQHIHAMKNGLELQIAALDKKVDTKIENLTTEMHRGFEETRRSLEEAREHRQALQEDLEATMRMLHKHDVKLARL